MDRLPSKAELYHRCHEMGDIVTAALPRAMLRSRSDYTEARLSGGLCVGVGDGEGVNEGVNEGVGHALARK